MSTVCPSLIGASADLTLPASCQETHHLNLAGRTVDQVAAGLRTVDQVAAGLQSG